MSDMPKKIGPYLLGAEIGVGGLGRVFRAVDERTGKTVAIKFLHAKYSTNRRFLGIFHRELLIVSRLHHKHIVDFVDAHFDPPLCFIVSEFIDGWSGHKFLKTVGKVPPLVALSIIIEILQGIDYLHLHDVIHADLSAANYLIETSGRVLVTDFGLACDNNIENYKNFIVGTPGYYSPEHIGNSSMMPATDIYCVGLLLFELITGQRAVKPSTDKSKIQQLMKNIDFRLVKIPDRKLQNFVVKLLKQALHTNPKRRIQSTDKMMVYVYKILKAYNVRYSRYATRQFLFDRGLVKRDNKKIIEQNIYVGAA